MRFSSSWAPALAALSAIVTGAAAEQILLSNSLNSCQQDSQFTASVFRFVFTPANRSASIDLDAFSAVQGNVIFDVDVAAYGFKITSIKLDPCKSGLTGLCPMNSGPINLPLLLGPKDISAEAISQIPSIAYDFPDLDATIQIRVTMADTGKSVACVEANISNGKTVNLLGVKWALAAIAGLVLISSAIVNGLGHANAAAHIASGFLSLFGFFQTQAILGLTAVHLPPVVQSWTQDFQWTIGIINVGFMQSIFTWYQRATGGTPSTLFDTQTTASVRVLKRGLSDAAASLFNRAVSLSPMAGGLVARDDSQDATAKSYVVYGIERVAYKEGIEPTNLFITGFTFCYLAFLFTIILVVLFKGFCELAARAKWLKPETFSDFRQAWKTYLRGIMYRLTFISYPPMTALCFWELTRIDSPAEAVLAVCMLVLMTGTLGWAAFKICRIARRSISMHKNPAYILFSDQKVLNKWGFVYIQFRASAYYYMIPVLGYILVKSIFVAFAQKSGTAQAIGLLIIEAAALVAASVLRPWMDKKTNSVNIAICAVNFVNAIFLLIFSDIFDQPAIVNGVIGLVLFFLNAIFALVLLIMLIVTTVIIFFRANPDARYQFMSDDRASFMKSQSQLAGVTELDALAATARGEKNGYKPRLDLDDTESISESTRPRYGPSADNLAANRSSRNLGRPIEHSRSVSPVDDPRAGNHMAPPSPLSDSSAPPSRHQNEASTSGHRPQNYESPWKRGAGYDH